MGIRRDQLEFLFAGPLYSIFKQLKRIDRRLGDMATQAEVDALTQRLSDVGSQLSRGLTEVQGSIQDLKDQLAAGASVDLSGLEAQVDSLAASAAALDNVVPEVLPAPTEQGPGTTLDDSVPQVQTPDDPEAGTDVSDEAGEQGPGTDPEDA